jgi:hypothetical protein
MGVMVWNLTSNQAKVTDRVAVEAVLSKYTLGGEYEPYFEQGLAGDVYFGFGGRDWPNVLRYEKYGLSADSDEDCDQAFDLLNGLPRAEANQNFAEMLAELGQRLKTPLTVQVVQYEDDSFPIWACEWHVRPGSGQVEVNQFQHSDDPEGRVLSDSLTRRATSWLN